MALQLKDLLSCFDLCDKVVTYAKNEGANLKIHKCPTQCYVICFNDVTTIIMDMLCPKVVNMLLMMCTFVIP
jgi:hypothetical protein